MARKRVPDWDETLMHQKGHRVVSVEASDSEVRFTFVGGKVAAVSPVTVRGEKRSVVGESRDFNGKLKSCEVIKCRQLTAPGETPVRSVATVEVRTESDTYSFDVTNEHDGTDPNVAGFQFKCSWT